MATDRIPLSTVNTTTEEVAPITVDRGPDGYSFMDDITYHRMADYFDINLEDRHDRGIAEKVAFLFDYAKEKIKTEDRVEIQLYIKKMKDILGERDKGISSVKSLYKWARLDQQREKLEKEMESLYASKTPESNSTR